ncbi:MAG: hypothetical protein R3C14_10535 [Caldilineaceae bacterium]
MKRVAPLRYDVIFKKAFSDPEIFTAFVHDVLGVHIEINKVETEKSFKPPIGRVASRFDLFAEDPKNRIVVDIQHVRYLDHYDAFLHYHCAAILEQVAKAENYRPKLAVYRIIVLTSGDKHNVDLATIDFDPKTRNGQGLGEIPHKVVYLCPKYANDATPAPLREWLRAIDDTLDETVEEETYQNPLIQRIFGLIEQDSISPEERARMFEEYNQEMLKQETIQQRTIEIARAMLAKGLDIDLIVELTNLSKIEIDALSER